MRAKKLAIPILNQTQIIVILLNLRGTANVFVHLNFTDAQGSHSQTCTRRPTQSAGCRVRGYRPRPLTSLQGA